MMFRLLLLVANTFIFAYAWTVDNCPKDVSRDEYLKVFGDKCYAFELFRVRHYEGAQEYCEEDGGSLVIVKDTAVDDFINKTVRELYGRSPYFKLWMGLQYDLESEKYIWSDGSVLDYDNFEDRDGSHERCVEIDAQTGKWVRVECDDYTGRFVCEYPLSEVKYNKTEFASSITREDCPIGYSDKRRVQTLGDTCYIFTSLWETDFEYAKTNCEGNHKGSLAMVKSQQINDFLQYHLYTTHRYRGEFDSLWIGLRYNSTTNDYRWMDGTAAKFNNFESNDLQNKCVAMSAADGKWVEAGCDRSARKHYICEAKPYF